MRAISFEAQTFRVEAEQAHSLHLSLAKGRSHLAVFQICSTRLAARQASPPKNSSVEGKAENFPLRPFDPYWMGSNWHSWDKNNNDADKCCMHTNVTDKAYLVWRGHARQGFRPFSTVIGVERFSCNLLREAFDSK